MDEVHELCRRVLGDGPEAAEAAGEALAQGHTERVSLLAAAARACRARANGVSAAGVSVGSSETDEQAVGLAAAVAAEVRAATARLPERHREALALREALELSHDQIAAVMELDRAAVAPLLARARLRLREERRGGPAVRASCEDRDRALRLLACRQDAEPFTAEDDEWLLEHLAACRECDAAHAAMLEVSIGYR
jgi:predicted DNA-binding protein (UPF0251 family)